MYSSYREAKQSTDGEQTVNTTNAQSKRKRTTSLPRRSRSLAQEDTIEQEARERKLSLKKESWRKAKWQAFVLVLCCLKYFTLSVVQGQVPFYRTTYFNDPIITLALVPVHVSFLAGFILAGNVIDNIGEPKRLIIYLEAALALVWLILGLLHAFIAEKGEPILYFYTWCLT